MPDRIPSVRTAEQARLTARYANAFGLTVFVFTVAHAGTVTVSIRFKCRKCGRKLKAKDEAAGQHFDCPQCHGRACVPDLTLPLSVLAEAIDDPDPWDDEDTGELSDEYEPGTHVSRSRQFDEVDPVEVNHVILTTTHSVEGHRIESYLGIESVEFVIGTGFLSELTGGIADLFGRRSRLFEGKLHDAKREAFEALKYVAMRRGANAVVGIDMDYTEFSGNRVALILNGTLVYVERDDGNPH